MKYFRFLLIASLVILAISSALGKPVTKTLGHVGGILGGGSEKAKKTVDATATAEEEESSKGLLGGVHKTAMGHVGGLHEKVVSDVGDTAKKVHGGALGD